MRKNNIKLENINSKFGSVGTHDFGAKILQNFEGLITKLAVVEGLIEELGNCDKLGSMLGTADDDGDCEGHPSPNKVEDSENSNSPPCPTNSSP